MRTVTAAVLGALLLATSVAAAAEAEAPKWRRPVALAGGAAAMAGLAAYSHWRADVAYAAYSRAGGDYDRQWSRVLHWETSRDASLFAAAGLGVAAFVFATARENPGIGAIFTVVPAPGGGMVFATIRR